MLFLWLLQGFAVGVSVSVGCLSWLSVHFGGLGHIPRVVELPGIVLANFLDQVPDSILGSRIWPNTFVERLEARLDNYQCPAYHEYRVEIVHHEPLILHLRGFLPSGEAEHILKLTCIPSFLGFTNLSDERSVSSSWVSKWTADDPTRMYLEPDEDKVVACLEARIAKMSGYNIRHQEAIQVHQLKIRLISRSFVILERGEEKVRKITYGRNGSCLILHELNVLQGC